MTVQNETRVLIDGKLVDADSGATFDSVNPSTEDVIAHVADASSTEMHRAIGAARRAFDETTWSVDVSSGSAASGSSRARWYGPDVSFGGYKDSGVGRQNGGAGFDQYLELKSLAWPKR